MHGIAGPGGGYVSVSYDMFAQAMQNARNKMGGFARLSCAIQNMTQEAIPERTFFRWQKGINPPRPERMAHLYEVFRRINSQQ
jgi:hypothetical protein